VQEIQKDVDRLKLISDRFGKIGSQPHLEERDVVEQIRSMMEYIRKRATGKVQFGLQVAGLPAGPSSADGPQVAGPGEAQLDRPDLRPAYSTG
jgi:hypothetical protein